MRVISQNGTIDVPYEQVTIQRENKGIYFLNANISDEGYDYMLLASYSSEEKAKKAMDMMRDQYSEFETAKLLVPSWSKEINKEILNEFSMFNVFRFPMDDEIPV